MGEGFPEPYDAGTQESGFAGGAVWEGGGGDGWGGVGAGLACGGSRGGETGVFCGVDGEEGVEGIVVLGLG